MSEAEFDESQEEKPIQVIPFHARPIVQPDFCIGCKFMEILEFVHDPVPSLGLCKLIETYAEWPAFIVDDVAKGCYERKEHDET